MPQRTMNVKIRRIAALCCSFIISASVLSGCKSVSEEPRIDDINTASVHTVVLTEPSAQPPVTSDAPSAEVTSPPPESVTGTEQTAETSPPQTETITEASSEESQTSQTLQSESPPETAASSGTSAAVTEPPAETSVTSPPETAAETTVTTSSAPKPYAFGTNSYSALNFREQKGVWISYLEYSSILQNKSLASFRKSIGKCFDDVKSLGFNTVYTQVRAYGDAYYNSGIFPSGDRYTGTMGAPVNFDALKVMVEEAHGRGLSIHAWINPMRLMTDSQMKSLDDRYILKQWYNDPEKKGKYIVESGGRWYLNPAYDEVIDLIAGGISEIISNYDVDGIQIDDYFYPTTASSFDKAAYAAYGGGMSVSEWRKDNVNAMVKRLCRTVHNANSSVIFGISPQGSVENNYNELYADVKAWCASTAYCDYILPQVYFGFDNAALPYTDTINQWSGMTSSGNVKLVIGLAGYKVGAVDNYAGKGGKNEWVNNSDILSRQIAGAKELSNYGGVALFRYGSLFSPEAAVSKQVSKELEEIRKNG